MKILAIDDNKDNLTTLQAIVPDVLPGCTLLTALNGASGLDLALAEDPDVILLDIVMPGMDGYEVCRRLKADERSRPIPVVFLTALRTDRESRIRALESGADGFLAKPVDDQELVAKVRSMAKVKAAMLMQRNETARLAALVAERTQSLQQSHRSLLNMLEDLRKENTARREAEAALIESGAVVRKKLQAIIEPEGDIGMLGLADIIDQDALQALMEDFYRFLKVGCAIVDTSGKVLVACGWQDICTKFHRKHPDTLKNCIKSDTLLTNDVPLGTFKAYRCKNGMWDVVTPIEVGGKHVGNIFLGQFFFENESPSRDLFREQARQYGFNEAEYLAAFDRVPRWSQETVNSVMAFYAKLAKMISSLSYSTIKLAREITERKRNDEKLRSEQALLLALMENLPDRIYFKDTASRFLRVNPALAKKHGLSTPAQAIGKSDADFFSVEHAQAALVDEQVIMRTGQPILGFEERETWPDGSECWLLTSKLPLRDPAGNIIGTCGISRDITARKRAEDELQRHIEDLRVRNAALTRFNAITVDRELRMIELKREVNELCLQLGEPPRHKVASIVQASETITEEQR